MILIGRGLDLRRGKREQGKGKRKSRCESGRKDLKPGTVTGTQEARIDLWKVLMKQIKGLGQAG